MNILDWLLLAGLLLSALVGLLRGAAYEIIALGGWVAAFVLARLYAAWLGEHLLTMVAQPELRVALAWIACFLLVLLAAGVLATLARLVLRSSGLGMVDRSLGAVFGVLRGALVVVLIALVAGYTPLPASGLWKGSLFAPLASAAAAHVAPMLPLRAIPTGASLALSH
ncbi:MAG: CvpA family protein [Betaproteobacteria bacterium]|nr:CvpA family protein [Betaproteobacteria bacterium]